MHFSPLRFARKTLPALCSIATALSLLTGCAGYKLGPTRNVESGEVSVQVNPFENRTMEPRLTEYVTSSVRKRLQQDGTYRLDTKDDGDIIVTGVITHFDRSELAFQSSDIRSVRDYNMLVTAQVRAVDRSTGEVILERAVTGRTSLRVRSDLASAERQAIPLLADELARNVTSILADGPW
jgi:hypothetical protein